VFNPYEKTETAFTAQV